MLVWAISSILMSCVRFSGHTIRFSGHTIGISCSHRCHIFANSAAAHTLNAIGCGERGLDSSSDDTVLAAEVLLEFQLLQNTLTLRVEDNILDSAPSWVLVWHENAIVFLLQWVKLGTIVASLCIILAKL